MLKKDQGYGICGSRNVYSSGVHLDNWVEDTFGEDLSSHPRPAQTNYLSNTARSFIHPSNMPALPQPTAQLPSVLELKTKNKDGMPYSILFEHGNQSPKERFQTVSMLTLMKDRPDLPLPQAESQTLLRQKSKKILEEINLSYKMTSEARLANAHLPTNRYKDDDPRINAAALPNFRRFGALTSTIPNLLGN